LNGVDDVVFQHVRHQKRVQHLIVLAFAFTKRHHVFFTFSLHIHVQGTLYHYFIFCS
jgi:hypothetical protein